MCVEPGKMCASEMMAIDAKGGLGREGLNNTLPLTYDKYARRGAVFGPEPTYVAGICSVDELKGQSEPESTVPFDTTPLRGAGLKRPLFSPANPSSSSLLLGSRPKSDS
jgi:cytochrome o ubiquinol oxidase subunit 2